MGDLILGLFAAIGASILYSIGVALQALDAREAPPRAHLRLVLARRLLRRRRWLLGTGLSILGWPLQVLALTLAPLVVVQPSLAAGLVVLMFAGERMLGERPGRFEYIAMAAIIAGVAGTAAAAPHRSTEYVGTSALYVVMVALSLASFSPYVLRAFHRPAAALTMLSAGLAFGLSGVTTKLASDALEKGHLGIAAAWAIGTGAVAALGALSEMSALQSRSAIQVAPVVFVTQTVVPVMLALLLLGESFTETALGGPPLAISLALLVGGAALLERSALLVALLDSERIRTRSETGASPSRRISSSISRKPASEEREAPAAMTRTSPARTDR